MKINQLLNEDINLSAQSDALTIASLQSLLGAKIHNSVFGVTDTVNVDGSVYLDGASLSQVPLTFGKVTCDFYIKFNNLKSLKGAPKYVGGEFDCSKCDLTDLKHSPEIIKDNFKCSGNHITSLIGINKIIKEIGGSFKCDSNPIVRGGLGLLFIKGLYKITYWSPAVGGLPTHHDFFKAAEIINEYLGGGDSNIKGIKALYLCEDELIQAGLEAFAQI